MLRSFMLRCLPLLMGLSLVTATAPAARAQGDVGRQMEREYGVLERESSEGRRFNSQLDEVVDRIVRAVNSESNRGDFRLKSAKILGGRSSKHDKVVNAFALPDGRIYVTLGLMRALENSSRPDDELAFVVGHEVAHVTEKHGRSQQKASITAGVAAILLGAVTKSSAVSQIAGLGANAYVAKYSRTDEYDADKHGLMAMHRAGYDPDAAVSMLNRLKGSGEDSNRLVNGWFGSHPLTTNRMQRVKAYIADLEAGRPLAHDDDDRPRRRRRS